MEIEHFFTCPYCWQKILLDLSVKEQYFIEDCEVGCRPIEAFYETENFELIGFQAENINQ